MDRYTIVETTWRTRWGTVRHTYHVMSEDGYDVFRSRWFAHCVYFLCGSLRTALELGQMVPLTLPAGGK